MNKFLLASFFIVLSIFTAQAQRDVTITGQVIEQNTGQPLEYATVAFFSKTENRIVTGGITTEKGEFSIPVAPGTYDISIEFISFKKQIIPRSEEHTSELQSRPHLVCRLL